VFRGGGLNTLLVGKVDIYNFQNDYTLINIIEESALKNKFKNDVVGKI